LYDAGSSGVVSNPANWGWHLQLGSSVPTEASVTGVFNDTGPGLHAWQIDDGGTALTQPVYTTCLDFAAGGCGIGPFRNAAVQNGWRLATRARFVTDYNTAQNGDGSMGLNVWIDGTGYFVLFDLSSNNLRGIVYSGSAAQEDRHVLTAGGTGTAAYHDIALVYNPISQLVRFEFDGMWVDSTAGQPAVGHPNTLGWGNVGTDRGKMNFRNVTFAISLPGDYNRDDIVDAADYSVWRNRLNTSFAAADGNGNGTVDAADYTIWRRNYGRANIAGSGGVTRVPEPATIASSFAALAVFASFRRRYTAPPLAAASRSLEFEHGRVRQSGDRGCGADGRLNRPCAARTQDGQQSDWRRPP
jgi:hypothetical protein